MELFAEIVPLGHLPATLPAISPPAEFSEAASRGVFTNFAKFIGKHLCRSLFLK